MKFSALLLIIFILKSCSFTDSNKNIETPQKDQTVSKPKQTSELKISATDKIIISESVSNSEYRFSRLKNIRQITDLSTIIAFEKLLRETPNGGYCCCPRRDLMLKFYNKNNNYKTYYIDTTRDMRQAQYMIKNGYKIDGVLVYSEGYSYSRKIPYAEFEKLINQSKKNQL